MPRSPLIINTDAGLYCPVGDFHIDPWQGVERAVITHAHSDHARWGSKHYLCSELGAGITRRRVGRQGTLQALAYSEQITINGVRISLHPAGHIIGSAQVRIENDGEVWVVTGDYKLAADPTCTPFEPVRCDTFITECTFGLPIYRWRPEREVFDEINAWWRANQVAQRTSVIYAYALGKAQRVLAGVDPAIGPILVHGAVKRCMECYDAINVALPEVEYATDENAKATRGSALVVAPPSARGTPWLRKFGPISDAMVSGWMTIRGTRRRRSVDRGFTLSDHVDWPDLHRAISETGATRIGVTHGYVDVMHRWLSEQGINCDIYRTRFVGELVEDEPASEQNEDAEIHHGDAESAENEP